MRPELVALGASYGLSRWCRAGGASVICERMHETERTTRTTYG